MIRRLRHCRANGPEVVRQARESQPVLEELVRLFGQMRVGSHMGIIA
jgi:hypothetical protein